MIISHHPVLFHGLKKITGDNYIERILVKAIKNDIVLYAAHTNIDRAAHGISRIMAEKLGLNDIAVLLPTVGMPENVGFGAVGNLSNDLNINMFFDLVKQVFAVPCMRHSARLSDSVRRIAVCGGSGAFLLQEAIAADAQCFVTADLKYHDFFNANGRLVVADIGHYESEKCVLSIFYELLTKKMPNFAVRITGNGVNPVYYY
jgi:dinuclear metal center YbgI/SA1388 family protein